MLGNDRGISSLVIGKFEKCYKLLTDISGIFSNSIQWGYNGEFDYDPINNDGFIEFLCSNISDKSIYILYVGISSCEPQKTIVFNREELLTLDGVLKTLRLGHAELHNCTVEGSCYITGDLGEWVVFYDAQTDAGIMLSNEITKIKSMSGYIF